MSIPFFQFFTLFLFSFLVGFIYSSIARNKEEIEQEAKALVETQMGFTVRPILEDMSIPGPVYLVVAITLVTIPFSASAILASLACYFLGL